MDKLLLRTCPRTVGSAVATGSINFSFAVIQIEDLVVLFYIIKPTLEYVMHIRTGLSNFQVACTLYILKSRKIKQTSIDRKFFLLNL